MDCAKTGIPAELISMPLSGATAPVTLAGSITQHCAESLSGVVIHQLAQAGSPIIYGGAPAIFDMRSSTTPFGAVETGMSAIIAALSGVNNISGPGILDFIMCQSLEKLVLDNELCGMAKRLVAGIAVRDDPIAQPCIEESMATNEFLSLAHTLKWFREEVYIPDKMVDRGSVEGWREAGKPNAQERAGTRLRQGQRAPGDAYSRTAGCGCRGVPARADGKRGAPLWNGAVTGLIVDLRYLGSNGLLA